MHCSIIKWFISSKMDVETSKIALWETISNGLPQISASGSFTDNLKLMTTLLPDFIGGTDKKIPVTFGSKYNSGATVSASLLLFNAPLYIGIETTKLAQKLSEQSLVKSELDTRESVASAYYLILVSEKSLQILEGNIENLNETLKSTRSMYSAGMAESTDVDQMVSNVSMIENSKSSMERTIEVNYNLLRFQLGVTPDTKIVLSETLDNFISLINIEALITQQFDQKQNVNFKLMEQQEQMSALMLKTQKASVLPTLAGFYSYGITGMGDKVSGQQWFKNSMTGLQLSVPIFASGQRYSSIRKAQINLDKARNTKDMIADQLTLQEKPVEI